MSEWGVPDWSNSSEYVAREDWNRNRWRWEFVRRRDDVRSAFDEAAQTTFERKKKLAGKPGFPDAHLRPEEPGFCAMHLLAEEIGLPQIPNPRIGNQPWGAIAFNDWPETLSRHPQAYPPDSFHRVDFDLDKPLGPQISFAKTILKELQKSQKGKPLQKRSSLSKWPTYLRVLDARDAGASLSEIATFLTSTDRSPQSARDALNQARALCFNF